MVQKRNAGRSRPMGEEIGNFTWETYFSLSTMPADVQSRFWSRNLPCFCGHALNCVFRYCLISLGDAVCGTVPSLYWSRAAAMCALSSFSELQNIARHRSREEIKSRMEKTLLNNGRIKRAQGSRKFLKRRRETWKLDFFYYNLTLTLTCDRRLQRLTGYRGFCLTHHSSVSIKTI